jgi:hypothetical protein
MVRCPSAALRRPAAAARWRSDPLGRLRVGALATTVGPVGAVAVGVAGVAGDVGAVGREGVAGERRRTPVERRRVVAGCRVPVRRWVAGDVLAPDRRGAAAPVRRAATNVAWCPAARPRRCVAGRLADLRAARVCWNGGLSELDAGNPAVAGGRPAGLGPIESATSPRTRTAATPAIARRTVEEPSRPASGAPAAGGGGGGGGGGGATVGAAPAAGGCGSGAMAAGSSASPGACSGPGLAPPAADPMDGPSLTIGS